MCEEGPVTYSTCSPDGAQDGEDVLPQNGDPPVSPFGATERLMAMLYAYFDESGTHAGSKVIAIAGWLAPESMWIKFQREWKRVLDSKGIEYFHMNEYEHGDPGVKPEPQPPYNWDKAERITFLRRLIDIVRNRTQFSVSFATDTSDYPALAARVVAPPSAYAWCATRCLKGIVQWCEYQGHAEPIAYVFEDGAGHNGELEKLRDDIMGSAELKAYYRMGSLGFADKETLNPLQAADMLAYEIYKEMDNFHVPESESRKLRGSMRALLTSRNHQAQFYKGGSIYIVLSDDNELRLAPGQSIDAP